MPFSADQLFAVIADVDAYAKFLPLCTASRVVGRHGPESFDAELGIGFLAFDERYVSRVTLERPRAVSAVATNSGPLAHCRTAWRLRDADADAPGCELDFRLSMQMRTLLHDQALRRVIDRVVDQQVAAFRSRCEALYPDGATPTRLSTRLHVVGSAPSASASTPPPPAAGAPGAAAAPAPPPPPPPPLLQIDPSWRHAVEAAFDAHASGGHLSLRGFVQACRALDARGGVFPESVAALLAPRDGGGAESGGGGGGGGARRRARRRSGGARCSSCSPPPPSCTLTTTRRGRSRATSSATTCGSSRARRRARSADTRSRSSTSTARAGSRGRTSWGRSTASSASSAPSCRCSAAAPPPRAAPPSAPRRRR